MKFTWNIIFVLALLVSCFGSKNTKTPTSENNKNEVEFNRETVEKNCFCEEQKDQYGRTINKVKEIEINKTLLITDRSVMEALDSQFRFSTQLARKAHGNDFSKDTNFFNGLLSTLSSESKKQMQDNWATIDNVSLSRFGTPYKIYAVEFITDDMKTSSTGQILSAGKIRLHYKFLRLDANGDREDIQSVKRLGFSETSLAYIDYHLPTRASAYPGEQLWDKDKYSEEILKLQCYLGRRGLGEEPRTDDFSSDYQLALIELIGSVVNRSYKNRAIWKNSSALAGVTIIDSLSEGKVTQLELELDGGLNFKLISSKELVRVVNSNDPNLTKVVGVYLDYFKEINTDKVFHPYISDELNINLTERKNEIAFRITKGATCQMPILNEADIVPSFSVDKACGEYKVGETILYTMEILNKGPAINKRTLVNKKLIECPAGTTLIRPPSGQIVDCDAERRNCHIETSGSSDFIEISNIPANASIHFYMDCRVDAGARGKTLNHSITANDWKLETSDPNLSNNNASVDVKIVSGTQYGDTCNDDPVVTTTTTTTTKPVDEPIVDYDVKFWIGDDVVATNKQLVKITIHNVGQRDSVDPLKLKYSCPKHSSMVAGSARPTKGVFTSDTWILRELKKGTKESIMWNCLIDKDAAGEFFTYQMEEGDFTFPGIDSNPENNLDGNRRRIQRYCDYDYTNDGRLSAADLVHVRKVILGTVPKIDGKTYFFERSNKADGNRYAPISSRHLVLMQKYILGQIKWDEFFGQLPDCAEVTPRKP